jgi:hypothetical protein
MDSYLLEFNIAVNVFSTFCYKIKFNFVKIQIVGDFTKKENRFLIVIVLF